MSELSSVPARLPAKPGEPVPEVSARYAADNVTRWSKWARLTVERVPAPFYIVVLILAGIAAAEQVYEYTLDAGSLLNVGPDNLQHLLRYLTQPLLTAYELLMLRALKSTAVRSLAELRPAVQIDDEEYDTYVRRMIYTPRRAELALLLIAAALVILSLVVVDLPLIQGSNIHVTDLGPGAAFVLTAYVIMAWAFFTFVFSALRLGSALGKLAHRPLEVNIYDPGNLLPFGHIALVYSLSLVGVILILLIGLGLPSLANSWVFIALVSAVTLVALVVPLWGVNRQMREARHRELGKVYEQLRDIHDALVNREHVDPDELKHMTDRTVTLTNLRKVVLETPTWPYRDALTVVRVLVLSIAPLIYFVLNLLIGNLIAAGATKH